MNVAGFGDAARQQNPFCPQFEGLRHVLTVLYPRPAKDANVGVHGLDSGDGVANDGWICGGDRDVAPDEFGRFNGDVRRAQFRKRLGFVDVGCARTHGKTIGEHLEQRTHVVQLNLVLGVVDDGALGTTVERRLRFQPSGEPTQSNRVKVLGPDFHVGGLFGEGGQVKGGGNGDHGGGAVGVRFHGGQQRFRRFA